MLLDEFSTIFDRPEKVKKLREYILSLAVRGKLVEQDKNDEPASVLLERIREEKNRLVKEKKIKKEKPLPEISEDEIPYELPKGWEWVRLGNSIQLLGGNAFKSNAYVEKSQNQVIRLGNVKNNELILNNKDVYISEALAKESETYSIREHDVLITMTGTRGKRDYFYSCIVENKHLEKRNLFLNQRVGLIRTYKNTDFSRYLNIALKSTSILDSIFETETGTANQGNIGTKAINNLVIPLPPMNEQKRLVEKVEYLMEFCDKLETQLEKKVRYGSLSAKSVLNGVSNCSSYEELKEALRFIIENFKDLTLVDGAITELKNAILSLAVKGKIVLQDESDEPASVLLDKIREEKDRLVKENKIKKEKPLPEISEDEISYELPRGWEWVRMSDIVDVRDGTHDSPKYIENGGYPLVTGKDFYGGKLNFSKTKYISKEDYEKIIQRSKVDKGDILFSMIGGNIGSMVMIEDDMEIAIKNVALFKTYADVSFNSKYLMYYLMSNIEKLKSIAKGGAQPFVSLKLLRSYEFALPPLNEQNRIVKKVDKLIKVRDELELRIEKSKKYSEKLIESILKDSFKA